MISNPLRAKGYSSVPVYFTCRIKAMMLHIPAGTMPLVNVRSRRYGAMLSQDMRQRADKGMETNFVTHILGVKILVF